MAIKLGTIGIKVGITTPDELEHAIQHCLNNLPLEFKSVVVMADIQGMDYSEVAIAVRVPLGTIKSRMFAGLARLREVLDDAESEGSWTPRLTS